MLINCGVLWLKRFNGNRLYFLNSWKFFFPFHRQTSSESTLVAEWNFNWQPIGNNFKQSSAEYFALGACAKTSPRFDAKMRGSERRKSKFHFKSRRRKFIPWVLSGLFIFLLHIFHSSTYLFFFFAFNFLINCEKDWVGNCIR